MKKVAIYCLQLLSIVGIVSLTSCGTSDPVTPQGNPTITAVADPAVGYKNNKFEKGDKIKVRVTANVPGGVQIFQVWKKVGTATTGYGTDVSSTYSSSFPAAGATSYTRTFEINVNDTYSATADNNKITITFRVKNSQATTFTDATYQYEVVTQGQGGGGGVQLLLRATANVTLGSQASTLPSYASSQSLSTGSSLGLYTSAQAGLLNSAQKQAIDLTFGIVGADGNFASGAAATTPQFISPDTRESKLFNNPLGTDARATTFKLTTITAANFPNITASNVNNDIDHSTGTVKFINMETNKVYSFVNAQGAKGYVLVKTINIIGGANDNREANIDVLVQQLQ